MLVAGNEQDMPVDIKKHVITTVNIFEPAAVIIVSSYRLKKKKKLVENVDCQSSSVKVLLHLYGLGLLSQAQLPAPVVHMPEMT